jgi:hypothetical protein
MKRLTLTMTDEGFFYNSDYHCLSPLKVHAFLVGEIDKVVRRLEGINGVVRVRHVSRQAGPALKFRVTFRSHDASGDRMATFDMDFVPCFIVNGRQLVGKRHPSLPYYHEQTRATRMLPETLRWRQSFSTRERDDIGPLDKGDGAWCKKIYRLVKYLRYHQPQFRQFSSYVYKTTFLYLLDEHSYPSQWREQKLAARFMDYMRMLEEFFKEGEMNHYFLFKKEGYQRNLLKPDYDEHQINEFYNFLRRNNRAGESAWARIFENIC